jgi:uncharacterized cupredoxin-like copper-binding protein
MYRVRCFAGALVAAALTGCKSERASSVPSTVTVTARDFAFDAPATLPAGATTFHLVNQGKDLHHAQIIKLEEGKTLDDVKRTLKNHEPPPAWVRFVGGPNAPGQKSEATSVLEPGHYAYLCFIFGPDGVIHATKGMIREFEVTQPSPGTSTELPPADLTIKLVDYDFEPSEPLTPGRKTILVENAGPQPHELALLKLAPGKKVEDFAVWAETGMKGPPPAEPVGGVVFLDQGAKATFTADLTAGEYGLMCFVPDVKDGKPHLAHGMMKTIKVG